LFEQRLSFPFFKRLIDLSLLNKNEFSGNFCFFILHGMSNVCHVFMSVVGCKSHLLKKLGFFTLFLIINKGVTSLSVWSVTRAAMLIPRNNKTMHDNLKPSLLTLDPVLKMREQLCFCYFNFCIQLCTVQLQCLQRAPGRRVTEKSQLFHTNHRSSHGPLPLKTKHGGDSARSPRRNGFQAI
jgi:hypothetical protein